MVPGVLTCVLCALMASAHASSPRSADAGSAHGSSSPRLIFREGEQLCYRVEYQMTSTSATVGTTQVTASGDVVLLVQSVEPAKGATVEVRCRGGGAILLRGTERPLGKDPFTVTTVIGADGGVVNPESLPIALELSAGHFLAGAVLLNGSLFGIRLPDALPEVGKTWTALAFLGSRGQGVPGGSQPGTPVYEPVTYRFDGRQSGKDGVKLLFSYPYRFRDGLLGSPVHVCYDADRGEISGIALEGTFKGDSVRISAKLIKREIRHKVTDDKSKR